MGSHKAIENHKARDLQYFRVSNVFQKSFGWGLSIHGN